MNTPIMDLYVLIDWSQPFNEIRMEALDQVVDFMYKGTQQQVSSVSI